MLPPTPPVVWNLDDLLADLAAQEWAQRPATQTNLRDTIATLRANSQPVVNVASFGAKGNSVTDDTTAFQNALAAAAGKILVIPPAPGGGYYKIAGTLSPASNTLIQGCGLAGEVRQTLTETRLFNLSTVSNVTFLNVAMYGKGDYLQAWVDDNHLDIGITSNGGSSIRVLNCIIRNFALAGIYTINTTDVLISHNRVEGTHALGSPIAIGGFHQYCIAVTDSVPTNNVRILGNDVSNTAFGIDTSGAPNLLNSVIADNNVRTILQHAMYLGTTRLVVSNNVVTDFYNHGIKLYAGTVATQRDIACNGNHISSAVSNGFAIVIAAAATGVMTDVTCVGNQIRNTSATPTVNGLAGGVLVEAANNILIAKNSIRGVYTVAISVDNTAVCSDIAIDGNLIASPSTDGISCASPAGSARFRITNNKLSAIPAGFMGIKLSSAIDDVFVSGNSVNGAFNSVYNGGSATNLKITNNIFTGWASAPFPLSPVPVIYEGNQDGKEFTTYSATNSLLDYDRYIGVNATGGAVTMTVPTAVGVRGKTLTFIKTDVSANAVTISCPSVNINGAASQSLAAQFNKITIRSNGVTWFIVA